MPKLGYKRRIAPILLPHDIKRIRVHLSLSQAEAGRIIGGGPNAFQKYESGECAPSLALSNLLRVLDKHPAMMSLLIRQAA